MADDEGIVKDVKNAMNDKHHSIGEKVPGTPFAIVALSYLAVLALVCFLFAFVVWMTR